MKKILLIIFLAGSWQSAFSAPIAAVAYISHNSQRAQAVSLLIEQHALAILKSAAFDTINPGMISRELEKNSCLEETCILRFAENANLDLVMTGKVEDRGSYMKIKLNFFGISSPWNSRLISSRTVTIPLSEPLTPREFSLICEETAAFFISDTLNLYKAKAIIFEKKGSFFTDSPLSGKFTILPSEAKDEEGYPAEAELEKGVIKSHTGIIKPGDYILVQYTAEAERIALYYSERKREIVFQESSFYDTLFIMLTTPVASFTMPVAAPVFGYYTYGDWTGLGLWSINAAPYLYMEVRGFLNSPENLKEKKRDISRDDAAMNVFAWYMALAGGMSLFMDAYSHQYLQKSSLFIGRQNFLGNDLTAGYLALVSNGGGHFYKGHRGWGYFYFHLNNALLYMTLREYSRPETYNEISGNYIKGDRNTEKAILYGTALAVCKVIEITHTVLSGTEISCGGVTEEYSIPEPFFSIDDRGDPVYGLCFRYEF